MRLPRTIFVGVMPSLLLAFQIASAADPAGNAALDTLRKQYEASSDKAAATGRPRPKDPNFHQKLRNWWETQREQTDVGQRLARELIKAWLAAKDGSPDLDALQKELGALCADMTEPPVNRFMSRQGTLFSDLVRPYLTFGRVANAPSAAPATSGPHETVERQDNGGVEISRVRAMFLASLTIPPPSVRSYDREARQGIPREPWGWAIQDTYSLALARAGQLPQAREENKLLLTKVNLLLKSGPMPDLVPDELRQKRSFLVHRALIEWLAGDREAAKSRLDDVAGLAYLGDLLADDAATVREVQSGLGTTKK